MDQELQTHTPHILVVDDKENVALTIKVGLTRLFSCEVTIASSGEQALQLCEQQPFDMLVTDYKMPGMDGIELTARVRQLHPQTAVVMVTAYGDDELRAQARQLAIQRVLIKPVRFMDIYLTVLDALKKTYPKSETSVTAPKKHEQDDRDSGW
jgi:CheY-like chemotaxis protein